jgi:F0F1-type ATP synthase delta subunit
MGSLYGAALKRVIDSGVEPQHAIQQLVQYLKSKKRSRDIAPALKEARLLTESEVRKESIVVTEAVANSVSDSVVRKSVSAPSSISIIRKTDPTLSAGWIITYQGTRINASAKHQLATWYQSARTRI